jgi:anti-sigma regulatory factor (Ser/Thr protein kinase)/Fe-S-cluster-containing hydrogenase component 2
MPDCSHTIDGGNFDRAGEASGRLKEALKRVGAAPGAVRRTVIAAYEAEMNVVIHAHGGALHAVIAPDRVDVDIVDRGPGIPDVDRAMQEGFSTAPDSARALGFGAGMGLPNIRKNVDRMAISSEVGRGTRLHFTVFLTPQEAGAAPRNSLRVDARRCTRCLRCLRACPTHALRVRPPAEGRSALLAQPLSLPHLCIDCGECVRACRFRALRIGCAEALPPPDPRATLAVPFTLTAQRSGAFDEKPALDALRAQGWGAVATTLPWRAALRRATARFASARKSPWPVLPPFCPAVVNLVLTRFHALIPHLPPFLGPIEALRQAHADRPMAFAVSCPAEASALRDMACAQPTEAFSVAPLAGLSRQLPPSANGPAPLGPGDAVTGLAPVMEALERAENGLLSDVPVLELYTCTGGCAGSPWLGRPESAEPPPPPREPDLFGGAEAHRQSPLAPRAGIRLDADMAEAVRKLARIDALTRELPGHNCGDCGAPTCQAAAEDRTLGRIAVIDCPYR